MATLSSIITPSNVVTASSTATLTNKTLNLASNTLVATSAQLAAAVTDETGSGALVFANSPTLVTPALGIPSSATLTNATGLPLTTGVTGTLPVTNGGIGAATLPANNVLLGNGTSALQAVAPGSSGNVLTSNGTTWASEAASTGALVYVATVTASNSAQVRFESELTSTYDNYLIVFNGVRPATDNVTLRSRLKVGGSYQTNNYANVTVYGYYFTSSPTTHYNSTELTILRYGLGNATARNAQGQIYLSSPTSTTLFKTLNWNGISLGSSSTDSAINIGMGSFIDTTSAVTGIEFYMSSGNISVGTFRLYGIKNS